MISAEERFLHVLQMELQRLESASAIQNRFLALLGRPEVPFYPFICSDGSLIIQEPTQKGWPHKNI